MNIFFNDESLIFEIFVSAIVAYPLLILVMRLYGKRSLSKMNMFDFIITVALGSIFASTVMLKSTSIADGIVAFIMLLSLQYIVTFSASRVSMFDNLVKANATLVFHSNTFLEEAMKSERVTEDDILSAMRQNGFACTNDVQSVVLENDGTLSVIGGKGNVKNPTIKNIKSQAT